MDSILRGSTMRGVISSLRNNWTNILPAKIVFVLFCLLGNGCTSSTALEPQNALRSADTARLYFIRPNTFVGVLQSMRITIDGKKVGNLGVGTYFYIDRPPGQYNVIIEHEYDLGKWEQTITAPSKNEYYFKIVPGSISVTSVGTTSIVNGRMNAVLISETEGKSLIAAIND